MYNEMENLFPIRLILLTLDWKIELLQDFGKGNNISFVAKGSLHSSCVVENTPLRVFCKMLT